MLDLSYIIQDMTNTEINTTEPEFKVITDKKDEPDYKAVSKFVGGMVECVQLPNGDLLLLNEEGKLMGLPCLLYTSPSPRDGLLSRMPSSA